MTGDVTSRQIVPKSPACPEGLFLMDGIEGLRSLPKHSVDMLLTDPPYGTILPSRKQTTSLMMNFPHGLKMKRKIFKSWSMLENGQKQKRQKHLSITMKSLNLF